ncbi:MAG: hypothetical protein HY578_09020 [Nitrospinae bacterium]|nr:hypothetical protein [Nitrospinota bacterium]
MAEIILLANSRKLSHRCLAGIDIATDKWIRPVSTRTDKVITWAMRNIHGKEPELLDILNIPLSLAESDDESQPENRLIEKGEWTRIGRFEPRNVRKYLAQSGPLFYNTSDCVLWDELIRIPTKDRQSLMLIECSDFEVHKTTSSRGKPQARAVFSFDDTLYYLVITNYNAEQKVLKGQRLSLRNLLTISLAGKLSNSHPYCYKLVAGVIEL